MKKSALILSILAIVVILSLVFVLRKIFLKLEEPRVKVAIVIDDWGYNLRSLGLLKKIDAPLTISVLPNLRYSSRIAERAAAQGKEVILHLPLEPETKQKNIGLEKNTILTSMPKEEVIRILTVALASVPGAKGVSNHMGSLATADRQLMSLIFGELKRKDLFFLDSVVTGKSVCRQLARKMRVNFASRDIYLDNLDNYEYIKGQFQKLIEFAQANGSAVGIGHARPLTLKVLRDLIPPVEEEIKFVFISDLIE